MWLRRFRIVYKNGWYKVQARHLLFFWADLGYTNGEFIKGKPHYISTRYQALSFARKWRDKGNIKWEVVAHG
jgi:hypothetical protein